MSEDFIGLLLTAAVLFGLQGWAIARLSREITFLKYRQAQMQRALSEVITRQIDANARASVAASESRLLARDAADRQRQAQ